MLTNLSKIATTLALTAGFASFAASATSAATTTTSQLRYDGVWSVAIITEKGDCDRGYRYPIRISHGVLENGGGDPFTITGRVGTNGAITVTVSHGDKSASGSGRLSGNAGEGSWHGGSCSGIWTAGRRDS